MDQAKAPQAVDRIMITLDSLLDTRLGVIAQKYPQRVEKLLTGRNYFDRLQDRFPGITHEEFTALYKKRDEETLKNSMMTNITLLMGSFVKSAANDVLSGKDPTAMIFDINIHPYELDEETKQDLIGALEFHIGDAPQYNIVSYSNESLTPEVCKDRYAVMVMYDFADWMRKHAEAFKETRMPNMVIYAPRILEKLPTPEENKQLIEAQLDPFEASRLAASPAFTIRFLSIDMYSIRDGSEDAKRTQMQNSKPKEDPPVQH